MTEGLNGALGDGWASKDAMHTRRRETNIMVEWTRALWLLRESASAVAVCIFAPPGPVKHDSPQTTTIEDGLDQ